MAKQIGRITVGDFPITQKFGENPGRYAQFGLAGHNGIDFATPVETTILAGINGVVEQVGFDANGYGRYVVISDPAQNLMVLFAHLNSIAPLIQPGYRTNPQNPVGGSGNTGNSTGPHLHFAVGDTDSGGMRTNRENGYFGWQNPLDTNRYSLNFPYTVPGGAGAVPSPTAPGGTTPPGYTGPPPPPYPPSFAGQTVSYNGNSFRSDNGTTWIFRGSDADRKTASDAETARLEAINAAKAVDAGVYLEKRNLLVFFNTEGIHGAADNIADAEYYIIKGPFEARFNPDATMAQPWTQWYTTEGRFPAPGRTERTEVRKKPLPPAPAPLPEIPVPVAVPAITTTPPPTAATPPATTPAGAEPWGGAKAPTHKNLYNKIVEMFAKLLEFNRPA